MGYTVAELSSETWPDFERLFSGGNGWDFCWCMHFHRARFDRYRTRAEWSAVNKPDKLELVARDRTHGVLVYEGSTPIGWCQYGPAGELPRIDHSRKYRSAPAPPPGEALWRITCFVVDKKHRRRGVAGVALRGVLAAIARAGGGIVEGYPIVLWRPGTMADMATHGPAEVFRAAGFVAEAPYGEFNVLMRRRVEPA